MAGTTRYFLLMAVLIFWSGSLFAGVVGEDSYRPGAGAVENWAAAQVIGFKQIKSNNRPFCLYSYYGVKKDVVPADNPAAKFLEGENFLGHPDVQKKLIDFQCQKLDLGNILTVPKDWPDYMLAAAKNAKLYSPLVILFDSDLHNTPVVISYNAAVAPKNFREKFIEACDNILKHEAKKKAAPDKPAKD